MCPRRGWRQETERVVTSQLLLKRDVVDYLISFRLRKKIIYYFRVVFTGGKKEYFVEQKTYSSRVVNNLKIASKHKGHSKVYARPIFDMFCNTVC